MQSARRPRRDLRRPDELAELQELALRGRGGRLRREPRDPPDCGGLAPSA